MSFITYDLIFFVISIIIMIIFFYKKRSNFKIEGPLYLYRTKIGLKIIDWTSRKYAWLLRPMQYIVVISGYLLMAFMIWALLKISYVYLTSPTLARELKVPVIFPLVPYLPELFKLDFLPPFYFTYWIIVIAIIAIPHEFAHGIFARLHKITVHSTGFGFLRLFKAPLPFLAAFVEPDEKQVQKSKKFAQLSILASGTFANVLMSILFGLVFALFFLTTFTPAGVYFNTYASSPINISNIYDVHNVSFANVSFDEFQAQNKTYFASLGAIKYSLDKNLSYIIAYDSSPAFNAKLLTTGKSTAIIEIDDKKITSLEKLRSTIQEKKPGDQVKIKTLEGNRKKEVKEYNITLDDRDGKAFLGVGIIPSYRPRLLGWLYEIITKISNPFIYYESSLGDFGIFVKDLLWWIVLINIGVALTNMLPLGIFDGGRFFYITILSLTGSQKIAEKSFKWSTNLLLLLLAALTVKWLFAIF